MTGKVIKCTAAITVYAVTCPGVWLPNRGEVYILIRLWGQRQRTKPFVPSFPLFFRQILTFEKVFYRCLDPAEMLDELEDHGVMVDLIQMQNDGDVALATYKASAREFLYPHRAHAVALSGSNRELLLDRLLDFPGIAPKMEFTTETTIKEYLWLDHHIRDNEVISETRPKSVSPHMRVPSGRYRRYRSRSAAQARKMSKCRRSYSCGSLEGRPPFVVRKVDDRLISSYPYDYSYRHNPNIRGQKTSRKRKIYSEIPTKQHHSGHHCKFCSQKHWEHTCTVCRLYRRYFGRKYWGHDCSHPAHNAAYRHQRRLENNVRVVKEPYYTRGMRSRASYSDDDDDPIPVRASGLRDSRRNFQQSPRSPSPENISSRRLLKKAQKAFDDVKRASRHPQEDKLEDVVAAERRATVSQNRHEASSDAKFAPGLLRTDNYTDRLDQRGLAQGVSYYDDAPGGNDFPEYYDDDYETFVDEGITGDYIPDDTASADSLTDIRDRFQALGEDRSSSTRDNIVNHTLVELDEKNPHAVSTADRPSNHTSKKDKLYAEFDEQIEKIYDRLYGLNKPLVH